MNPDLGKNGVICLLACYCGIVTALVTLASGQTILIDDFDDREAEGWTTLDTTMGQPYGPGTFNAGSGAYQLQGAGLVHEGDVAGGHLASFWDRSSDPIFTDGFLRASLRTDVEGNVVMLMLRETPGFVYQFQGNTNPAHPRFQFKKIENGRTTRLLTVPGHYPFGVDEDWNIEAGAVGDQLSMKVWRVGEPEPNAPQLTFTDTSIRAGRFGVGTNIAYDDQPFSGPARVSATFDDIHFRIPEHEDVFTVSPYNIYLWEPPMPVPQVEGPFFFPGSPEKPDMRADVTPAEDWPALRVTGRVSDFNGLPIPGFKLDFWQVDDLGRYDNSGGYALRGHLFTDDEGYYELWTVMPANYELIRTRHLHLKLGGENLGFDTPVFTTQLYFPVPFDNDIDADGTPEKVIEGGLPTDFDAIALEEDFVTMLDLQAVGADFSDLPANVLTLRNDPPVDGFFDATLDIVMPRVFQSPEMANRTLIDNFNDGDAVGWSTVDSTLGQPWGPGIFDAGSGAYRLEGSGPVAVGQSGFLISTWDESSDPKFSDGFVRARVRAETEGTLVSLFLRLSGSLETGFNCYQFGGSTAGPFSFAIATIDGSRLASIRSLNPGLRLGVNEDWYIEAGAVGDQLSMKVWPVGDPEPDTPQLTFTDRSFSTGTIAVEAAIDVGHRSPARLSAVFDGITFEFPDVPNTNSSGSGRSR